MHIAKLITQKHLELSFNCLPGSGRHKAWLSHIANNLFLSSRHYVSRSFYRSIITHMIYYFLTQVRCKSQFVFFNRLSNRNIFLRCLVEFNTRAMCFP